MALPLSRILALALSIILLGHAALFAADRFTDNGDGTITDHKLKLVWSAGDNQGDVSWQDAVRWARFTFPTTLTSQDEGWRLPTLKELESLLSESDYYGGYEADCGTNVRILRNFELSCAWVWATEEAGVEARLFDYRKGRAYMDRKAKTRGYRALAVRPLTPDD